MYRVTWEPDSAVSPAAGDVLATVFFATSDELMVVTLPVFNPTFSSAAVAFSWVMPVTSGTVTCAEGPEEKWTVTVLPFSRDEPGLGDEETKSPFLTLEEA